MLLSAIAEAKPSPLLNVITFFSMKYLTKVDFYQSVCTYFSFS